MQYSTFSLFNTMYLLVFISCCDVDLQMAGDMAQQIPTRSVPMPGKNNKTKNLRKTTSTRLNAKGGRFTPDFKRLC